MLLFVSSCLIGCAPLGPQTPERESLDVDLARIGDLLANVRPSAQGVAIFACSAADKFFRVGQFDAPFERNQLFVGERPHIYPLARLIDQYRPYAVSDKDRQKKDHKRKDKKNQAMREGRKLRSQEARPRHRATDESNLTDSQPAPDKTRIRQSKMIAEG